VLSAKVLKAPAGLGKTRLYVAQVAGNVGVCVSEVYGPTLTLAHEWRDNIKKLVPAAKVQLIYGRTYEISPGVSMCSRQSMADAVSKAGLPVYQNLCSRSQGPGQPPDQCPHYQKCAYIDQFRPADVYIYTHAHLRLERGPLEQWWPREVIIDEAFALGMYERIEIPLALLTGPQVPAAARTLCQDVASGLMSGSSLAHRLRGATGPRGELNAAINALAATAPLSPNQAPQQQRQVLARHVDFKPVQLLLRQLSTEAACRTVIQSAVFDASKNTIVLHYRYPITRFDSTSAAPPNITVLDASADATILGRFFSIGPFLQLHATRRARVIQCSSARGSTTSFVASRNKDAGSRKAAATRLTDVKHLVSKLVTKDKRRVLVVGPSTITGNPAKGTPPLLKLTKRVSTHVELAHFNAVRGIDSWKDLDAVVIIGRNEPPVEAVEGIASAMFFDDPKALHLTGAWTTAMRGYLLANGNAGVDTIVHADARVQAVHEQIRECESVQAIDRLRLVWCQQEKLVYVLSNIPLDLRVHELRGWEELVYGTRLEQAWDRGHGVLPLQPAWLAATFPDLWASEGAAKKDVPRAGRKRGQLSNKTSIRNLSLFEFEYKRATARRWSRCLATSNESGPVQRQLSRLLGEQVQVRGPVPQPAPEAL
jgi:hypothetical protein